MNKFKFLVPVFLGICVYTGNAWGQGGPPVKDPPGLGKAHLGLRELHDEYQDYLSQRGPGAAPFKPSNPLIHLRGDSVAVEIVAANPNSLKGQLQALGVENISVYKHLASGLLPLSEIANVAALNGLRSVRPVLAQTRAGLVTSQGDIAMDADLARAGLGIDGTGATIGTLSDSYDDLGGAATDVSNNDLPGGVTVLADLGGGGTDEGRAMMQLIHDVAPGAGQAFHTAFNGQADFALGIEELAGCPPGSASGCTTGGVASDVIVDDVIYFAEPMFQDGVIAQAVDNVKANGVAYFSSAGNSARQSFESSTLTDSGLNDPVWGGALHAFDGATDALQSVTIPVGGSVIIVLQWDQPFFSVSGSPGSANDVDLWLFDSTGSTVLAGSAGANVGSDPVELIQFFNAGPATQFNIGISLFSGSAPGLMKYVYFGSMTINEYDTQSSTIYGHANALGAEAVGAAAYFDTPNFGQSPPLLEPFSSAGFTHIYFDTAGNAVFSVRNKPDIVAPDGTDTTFFGSDIEPNGFPNFFGTSAAAPHAAAVAALLLECDSTLTPDDVYNLLETTAIDMDAPGYDFDTGYGLINADSAAQNACVVAGVADKIGVYRPAQRKFILDFDGNRAWSPGVDIIHVFGAVGDTPIIGDWDGDGDDDIGTYRPAERKFILDMDDNGSWSPGVDVVEVFGAVGDLPIIGDWNGDGDDDIGTYRPAQRKFILDIDESGSWSPGVDIVDVYGAVGDSPIIGDWNGDGDDDIGVYRPAQRKFILDFDENRSWSPGVDIIHVFGAVGDTPIIGDWNGDGDDDIGTYRPSQRKFILDIDESGSWSPGVDIVDVYGTTGDQPLVGKW